MKEKNFNHFIQILRLQLNSALPGKDAQYKMAPAFRFMGMKFSFPPKKGAVLVLLYPAAKGEISLVLTLRSNYKGVHGGQISLPGGREEKEDRNLAQTALRETQEEIMVKEDKIEVIGSLSDLYIPVSNFLVHPVVAYTPHRPDFQPNYEVAKILEVPLDELNDKRNLKSKIITRNQVRLQVPFYDVQGHNVWGATAMILSEFFAILDNIENGKS